MHIHKNARTTPRSRGQIVARVLTQEESPATVASAVALEDSRFFKPEPDQDVVVARDRDHLDNSSGSSERWEGEGGAISARSQGMAPPRVGSESLNAIAPRAIENVRAALNGASSLHCCEGPALAVRVSDDHGARPIP